MGTIHVIGWLGADPKMQYTQDGVAVTNFSVAENRKYTRGDGEEIEETQWYQVSAWGNLGISHPSIISLTNYYLYQVAKSQHKNPGLG